MQSPTQPVIQPEWQPEKEEAPLDATRWLYRAQRFSLVRAHISAFAVGSVSLLAVNLLAGSPNVWASTWITAWGLIVIMHAIIAGIASLGVQLLGDEEDIRPASEVSWEPAATWQGAADSPDGKSDWHNDLDATETRPRSDELWHGPGAPPDEEDRVSWQAASDAAWLTHSSGKSDEPKSTVDRENT